MHKRRHTRGWMAAAALATTVALAGCWGSELGGRNAEIRASEASEETLRGEASLARGDRQAALLLFTRAIEINPRLTRAHLGMAEVYRLSGDYAGAERSARTAVQLEPENFDTQYTHGLMLHVLNRFSEAVGAYVRALRIRPDDFQANLNLATAYYQLNEARQALPYAENAVRLKPQDGRARFNLGVIYASLDRPEAAVSEYQQAAELMDLTPALLLNLSESLGRLGRYAEMRNTLERLVEVEPTATAYERLGFARFKLGEYSTARAAFTRSLELDPKNFPALNGLGVCDLNEWLLTDRRDPTLKDRAIVQLRQSLMLNRAQPRIEELLTRYK